MACKQIRLIKLLDELALDQGKSDSVEMPARERDNDLYQNADEESQGKVLGYGFCICTDMIPSHVHGVHGWPSCLMLITRRRQSRISTCILSSIFPPGSTLDVQKERVCNRLASEQEVHKMIEVI